MAAHSYYTWCAKLGQFRPTGQPASLWRKEAPAARRPSEIAPRPAAAQPERWDALPVQPIANFAAELMATRNLLSALAGPATTITVDAQEGALPVPLSAEDLTRIPVNLIKNAVEAMPAGGRIEIGLREQKETETRLILTVEDKTGPVAGLP